MTTEKPAGLRTWFVYRFLPSRSLQTGGRDAALAEANAEAGRRILASITPAMAVLFSWLNIQGWLGLTGPAVVWVPMLALMVFITVICVRAVGAASASEPSLGSR